LGDARGFGVCSKETWPPELPSDRDDSDALGGTGRDSEEVPLPSRAASCADGARASGWSLVDWRGGSSNRALSLLGLLKENGLRFSSELNFLSIDGRTRGRSVDVGSKDRLRRLNCCSLPRFRGGCSSWTFMVGAVVMMAGAGARYVSVASHYGDTGKTNYRRA
jgi:hypothetical protein